MKDLGSFFVTSLSEQPAVAGSPSLEVLEPGQLDLVSGGLPVVGTWDDEPPPPTAVAGLD